MSIKTERMRVGLTQKQLGEASGMYWKTIQKYEQGVLNVENMTLVNAKRLADVLGCDVVELLEK